MRASFLRSRANFKDGPRAALEPFSADDVHGYGTRRHQGLLMDRQTKKELWVLAISASAAPLLAGVAAFLIR
jgi:hypothetical protein